MVPVDSVWVSRDPTYSGASRESVSFRVQDFRLLWFAFPNEFCYDSDFLLHDERSYNPTGIIPVVWAISLSLAATYEIEFSFFSGRY